MVLKVVIPSMIELPMTENIPPVMFSTSVRFLKGELHKKVDYQIPCIRCSITSSAERGETAGFSFCT